MDDYGSDERPAVEEIAIMRHIRLGMGDRGKPVMTFECAQEGCAANQTLSWERAGELIAETGVGSIDQLEGRPCIVRKSGNGGMSNSMLFVRVARS